MKRLWAPWRSGYIRSLTEDGNEVNQAGCFFCDLPAAGPARHRENLILSAGEHSLLMLNRYPYNSGHLLVAPRAHADDPSLLPAKAYGAVTEVLRRATAAVREVFGPDGVNVGMNLGLAAGAGVADHCHYHVVPRWNGDTNFMPVVGEVKVIPIGLDETYARLLPRLGTVCRDVEGGGR